MVPDASVLFKSVGAAVGSGIGAARAPAGFWSYLKVTGTEAWALVEPVWNGEVVDWLLLEERCRHVGLALGGLLLTIAVWLLNARLVERPCARCGRRPTRRWRKRGLKTTCGVVKLFRQEHACICGTTSIPVDVKLGLPPDDRVSPGLARWSARVGATLPYGPARRFFLETSGHR